MKNFANEVNVTVEVGAAGANGAGDGSVMVANEGVKGDKKG
jgi:hypothetical protein